MRNTIAILSNLDTMTAWWSTHVRELAARGPQTPFDIELIARIKTLTSRLRFVIDRDPRFTEPAARRAALLIVQTVPQFLLDNLPRIMLDRANYVDGLLILEEIRRMESDAPTETVRPDVSTANRKLGHGRLVSEQGIPYLF